MVAGVEVGGFTQENRRRPDVGGDGQRVDLFNPSYENRTRPRAEYDGSVHKLETEELGFYILNSMEFTPQWFLDFGVRFDRVKATLFLSSPEEYDGGELTIEDTFGRHAIKLAAGSMVVYPSGSIHEVTPVTRGQRLACYLFMQSLVKDTEQRRHLFEMDMALIALRQRYGESDPDLVRLTGLYNNLVRRWSDC